MPQLAVGWPSWCRFAPCGNARNVVDNAWQTSQNSIEIIGTRHLCIADAGRGRGAPDEFPGRANPNALNRRGKPEHFMPDLKDPAAQGKKMQPKFFLTSAT